MMATQCTCFLPAAPARVGLRGASMQASSPQNAPAGDLSRRSFFGKFSAGVTVGALGLEVPQAAFAADLPVVNSPAPDFDLPSNRCPPDPLPGPLSLSLCPDPHFLPSWLPFLASPFPFPASHAALPRCTLPQGKRWDENLANLVYHTNAFDEPEAERTGEIDPEAAPPRPSLGVRIQDAAPCRSRIPASFSTIS
jgi:hypothetical protein